MNAYQRWMKWQNLKYHPLTVAITAVLYGRR